MAGPAIQALIKILNSPAGRKLLQEMGKKRPIGPKPPRQKPVTTTTSRAKVPDKVPTEVRRKLAGTGKPKKKPDTTWRIGDEVNRRVASRGWVLKKGKVVKKKQDDWEEGRRFERETNRLIREEKRKVVKKKPLSDARSEARRFEVETNRLIREEKRRIASAAKRKIKGLGIPPLAK